MLETVSGKLIFYANLYFAMQLEICRKCKRPYFAEKEFCPHCPAPYNPDNFANLGCLLLTVLPLVLMVLFWLFLFLGFFIR